MRIPVKSCILEVEAKKFYVNITLSTIIWIVPFLLIMVLMREFILDDFQNWFLRGVCAVRGPNVIICGGKKTRTVHKKALWKGTE